MYSQNVFGTKETLNVLHGVIVYINFFVAKKTLYLTSTVFYKFYKDSSDSLRIIETKKKKLRSQCFRKTSRSFSVSEGGLD